MKIYKNLIIICFISFFGCSSGGSDDFPTPIQDTIVPSAPTNLVGVSTSTASIDLSWTASTDNVGVKNYSIYKDNVALQRITFISYLSK